MKKVLTLSVALLLGGCFDSTVTVEISPSSEGQIHFEQPTIPSEDTIQKVEIPASHYIAGVPFTPQAPHANWDMPYQEACEEASIIMVDYYFRNAELTADQANREIVQIVNWQQSNGYGVDVTMAELQTIVKDYYGYDSRISDNVSAESVMYELSKGNLVVLPLAGRELHNPYFSGEGPYFHMLVVVGYDKRNFITHDPGTRRGEDYEYRHDVLINAVHDWTGVKEEILSGPKKMLIMGKN